jgi:prevent-host-death family protein
VDRLGELVQEAATGARVVISKGGDAVAVLVSPADFASLEAAEQERSDLFRALDASWDAFKDLDPSEVERSIDETVAEIRSKLSQRKSPSSS